MDINTFVERLNGAILNPIIALLFAVALIVFLWGIFEFIAGHDSEDKVSQGKQHMMWGIIGMFIMASAFGILQLIVSFVKELG